MEEGADLSSSLRVAVSAGETLPAADLRRVDKENRQAHARRHRRHRDAAHLCHQPVRGFASGDHGPARAGYEAKIIDAQGNEAPRGTVGRLAVRGPTGCRYLADARQAKYVEAGWNVTGDAFWQDEKGAFHFAARNDDMIISAGYNIAGPEVEAALLRHEFVAECAVIGADDEERGQIVEAHVVLAPGVAPSDAVTLALQTHVKAVIAPYKYPRRIVYTDALPKTQTGKIQRFQLRKSATA